MVRPVPTSTGPILVNPLPIETTLATNFRSVGVALAVSKQVKNPVAVFELIQIPPRVAPPEADRTKVEAAPVRIRA